MSNYKKLIGSILGSLTGAGVVALFAAFGVTLPLAIGVAIATIAGAIGTAVSPPNVPTA